MLAPGAAGLQAAILRRDRALTPALSQREREKQPTPLS
jgi:hypothetical protein